MYTVARRDGKVLILDHNGKPVFTSPEDGLLVYKLPSTTDPAVVKVKNLSDEDLLLFVATALRIE